MKTWPAIGVTLAALCLITACAGQHPYTATGAAVGGGLGALTGAAVDYRNPWRGAVIGGLIGGVAGGVAGDVAARSRYPQQGYYNQPYYGYQSQPYDQNYGYNGGYYPSPPDNNYGRPYPPPGYRHCPPYVAQRPEYYY